MKEFIQKHGDEVAIVIYDAPLPPKYFRLTKRLIRTLFVVVPFLLVTLLFTVLLWGLGSRIKEVPKPNLSNVMSTADSKIFALESEIKSLQESNQKFQTRLSQIPPTTGTEDPYLILVKKPYGMQNLLTEKRVTLGQLEFVPEKDKISLSFQIIRSVPETKVTGHVLVLMVSDAGAMVWPRDTRTPLTQGIKYSSGEPFSVSRLRPTNADFLQRPSTESVKFVIYIFTREGDLLLIHETEAYKLKATNDR
jgi:hypothetical protein